MILEKDKKDKNIFKKIMEENWEEFKKEYPSYDTEQYNGTIKKVIDCGSELGGYTEYRCCDCGKGERKVPFSCKSMFCLSCSKVYTDDLVSQVSKMLHPGMRYRHVVLTIPEQLRPLFYKNRFEGKLLEALIKTGYRCLEETVSEQLRKQVKIGIIVVLQTYGRSGQYNPHIHVIMSSGGINIEEKSWIELKYLSYDLLHKKWQYFLLEMIRGCVKEKGVERLIDDLYKKYPKGFVANVGRGEAPKKAKGLAKYLAKYVASPPISVRRIIEYTGEKVTYKYNDHETNAVKIETVDVMTFVGRMVQHILPKGFKRVRYYGIQATKTFKKWREIIENGIKELENLVKDVYEIVKEKCYRERYIEGSGKDPLKCPHCGGEMIVWVIWHPKYKIIYSEEERLKRGVYERNIRRSTIRRSSENLQISLFDV
jgi:hypothetical protein